MVDPGFGINDFDTPVVYSESETVAKNIMMLLYGKPGFYPSIPDLGMDVKQYFYLPFDDIDENYIKAELVRQCRKFIDNVKDGSFDVIKDEINGEPLLLFVVPININKSSQNIVIGITTNSKGELMYNFEIGD